MLVMKTEEKLWIALCSAIIILGLVMPYTLLERNASVFWLLLGIFFVIAGCAYTGGWER
jgi:1,4-dihydroxy-2-naphthoate octaprenyltransferase